MKVRGASDQPDGPADSRPSSRRCVQVSTITYETQTVSTFIASQLEGQLVTEDELVSLLKDPNVFLRLWLKQVQPDHSACYCVLISFSVTSKP